MTNSWTDIKNTDLVVVMGGNAAEAHPCGFKWVTEAKAHRGARLIVVDPRFTRTASVADSYAPIRPGTDIVFLMALIRWCIENDNVQWEYVRNFTNASILVKDEFGWADGLFTGYDEEKRDYDKASWDYQIGEDGFVLTDPTLQDPRCVWNLLKAHVDIYTPEMVERVCGTPKDKFLHIAEMIGECSSPTKTMTSMYALGWTQHSKGAQNIRGMAMLQLVLGNIGVRGGGMNALRGHSNIQGLTDVGLMSNLLPGYLNMPTEKEKDFETYMSTRAFKPLVPNQTSYWQNYSKFFVSYMKAMWGDAATAENDWAYDYLPKLDVPNYDILRMFELMNEGRVNLYFCQGFNPLLAFPNRGKVTAGLAKLKLLVTIDPLETETARFWENHGVHNAGRHRRDPDRGDPAPVVVLRRGRGLAHQLRPLAAVALAGAAPAGRGQARHLDHGADLHPRPRSLPRRRAARSPSRSSTSSGTMPTRATPPRRSSPASSTAAPSPR